MEDIKLQSRGTTARVNHQGTCSSSFTRRTPWVLIGFYVSSACLSFQVADLTRLSISISFADLTRPLFAFPLPMLCNTPGARSVSVQRRRSQPISRVSTFRRMSEAQLDQI
jgi:hypothetical protein